MSSLEITSSTSIEAVMMLYVYLEESGGEERGIEVKLTQEVDVTAPYKRHRSGRTEKHKPLS